MAALIEAISVKRRTLFEFENTPFTVWKRGQHANRAAARRCSLKVRNMLTSAVFEKTFKAGDKFKEPDLQKVRLPISTATAKVHTSWIRRALRHSRLPRRPSGMPWTS